jgi:hypothetical protein
VWWLTEPTLAKAREEHLAYQAEKARNKPPAMLIVGRSQPDPKRPGHLMCDRAAAAERVATAGLSVIEALCLNCPLKALCGDQRQRQEAQDLVAAGQGAVFFLASEYAFLPAPAPRPDHAVFDESLIIPAVKTTSFLISDIRALQVPNLSTEGSNVMVTLNHACDALDTPWSDRPKAVEQVLSAGIEPPSAKPAALAYLRKQGIGRKALRELADAIEAELDRRMPQVSGSMADGEIVTALDKANTAGLAHAAALVGAIVREIDRPRKVLNGVTIRHDGDVVISRRREILGLKHASVTALDGTGDYGLSRKLYSSRLAHVHVPFPRMTYTIATKLKGYSRQSITGKDRYGKDLDNRGGAAGKLRGDIAAIFSRLPRGSMICGTQRVVDTALATGTVPEGTACAWFGALRGLNKWERCPGGLFVGAERISIGDLENRARAYLADDDEPFISMDEPAPKGWKYKQWPYKATRMRRMRDGSLQPVEVEVHPDPRVQAVHEQIREAELLQAIDRLRSIWSPRQIVLLNDLCLDVVYDAIYRHKDLVAGGNRIERAFLSTGIVPLSPADLHRLHPTVFKTDKAAEYGIKNYPEHLNNNPIWNSRVFRYRRVGQHGQEARVVIDLSRHRDPRAAALAALGPLASFDGIACVPPTPKHGGRPAAKLPSVPPLTPAPWQWVPPPPASGAWRPSG